MNRTVGFAKRDEEQRIVYGVVLDPYQIDAHNDWIPPSAVEQTAHKYLANSRTVGINHSEESQSVVVESWIEPYPTDADYQNAMKSEPHSVWSRRFGDDVVHSGTWIMAVKLSEQEWEAVKEGKFNAFSIGGFGRKSQSTMDVMPSVTFIALGELSNE